MSTADFISEDAEKTPSLPAVLAEGIRQRLIRSPESLQRGRRNVDRILSLQEKLCAALKVARYIPCSLATFVRTLIKKADISEADAVLALGLPPAAGIDSLDTPSETTANVVKKLGIDGRYARKALKLTVISRSVSSISSMAARKAAVSADFLADSIRQIELEIDETVRDGGSIAEIVARQCEEDLDRFF